jgi:hypothetical protein
MAVSNPRSRFGFELVEQPLFIPALLNILYPPILLSHQFLPVLQCTRASWFEQFERQKSVGDDTWQLMPDWTRRCPTSKLGVPDFALFVLELFIGWPNILPFNDD